MITVGRINTGGAMSRLNRMSAKARQAVAAGLYRVAQDGQKNARMSILKGPKSGRLYGSDEDIKKVNYKLKGHKGALKRVHRASRAGEAPANDTGNLARNVVAVKSTTAGKMQVAYLRSNAKYSKALEYGTKDIDPRPFLNPAAQQAFKNIRMIIEQELLARGAYE